MRYRRIVAMSLDSRIQLSPPLSGEDVADLLELNVIRIHLRASKGETVVMGYAQGNEYKGMSFRRVDEDIDTDVLLAYRAGVGNEAILSEKFLGPPYDKGNLKLQLPVKRVVSVMSMNLKQSGGPDVLGFHLQGDQGERLVLGLWVSKAPEGRPDAGKAAAEQRDDEATPK